MKKLFLSLFFASALIPAAAKTVTFIGETSAYTPASQDEQIVTVPMNWTGQTIYCDAMNLYIGGGTRASYLGGIQLSNTGTAAKPVDKSTGNAYIQIVPIEGVTVKKISITQYATYKQMFSDFKGSLNPAADAVSTITWDGELAGSADMKTAKKFYMNYVVNMVDSIDQTDHSKESARIRSISIEYDGEPARCKMPSANITDNYITDQPIKLINNEPGSKLMYTLNSTYTYDVYTADDSKDSGFEEYDGSPLVLTQPTKISCYVLKDGQRKSGLFYQWYVPGPEGSTLASFNIMDPEGMGVDMSRVQNNILRITWTQFKNNGIKFIPGSNVTTNNTARLMRTDAYGMVWQMRYNSGNKDNNEQNRLNFITENADDAICAVVMKGSMIKGLFEPSQKEQWVERDETGVPIDSEGKQITFLGNNSPSGTFVKYVDKEYKFPDKVNFDDDTAPNYKTKMLPNVTAGNCIVMWKQSEDYEGDPSGKVIFEYNGKDMPVIHQLHVFYYKNSGDSAVKDLNGDANAPVEYYNMQGIRVPNPAKGQLLIKRQGAKTSKVII